MCLQDPTMRSVPVRGRRVSVARTAALPVVGMIIGHSRQPLPYDAPLNRGAVLSSHDLTGSSFVDGDVDGTGTHDRCQSGACDAT